MSQTSMFEAQMRIAHQDKDSMSQTPMFGGDFGKFILAQGFVKQTPKFGCHVENSRDVFCDCVVKDAKQSMVKNGTTFKFQDEICTSFDKEVISPKRAILVGKTYFKKRCTG